MIQITPQMRVLVAIEPVDLRKGIDGLAQLCREKLGTDPFSGYVFIFRGRRATAIKLLAFDGQGFWVAQKRLSKGRFRWWPTGQEATRTMQAGAPLDNNLVERSLKRAVLHRKNALFYRTLNGAQVGDLFMSLIHSCQLCGVNSFDYLTELQRHVQELTANPAEWMPWNYRETLARVGV